MSPTVKYKTGGVWTSTGGGDSGPAPYVRPADWVALPTVLSTDQKFVGLYAVYDHESNFIAVNCAGAYTVDWGDGTSPENIATGVQANHNYVFANLSSGTLSSRGYRQAVVTITPQAGQNLTTVNLFVKHNQSGLVSGYATGWLDIRMAGSLVSTLTIGSAATTVVHRMLEQFEYVGTSAIVTCANKFQNCLQLRSLIGTTWTASVTTMANMLDTCRALQTVPLFNTAAVTTMASMFNACSSLQTVPLFNTALVTNMGGMFVGCVSLQTLPLFNTASATNMASMFSGCVSLQTVPLFNTAATTGAAMASMFNACSSLHTVPLFNTAAVTNMSSMFNACSSLQTVPLFNTGAVTDMSSMFSSCVSLQTVPLFNTAAVTTMNGMFNGCSSLQTVPLFNTALVTNMGSIFGACPSLRVGAMSGTKVTISYASCALGPAALDAIYTNLASGVTAQTITVSSNWGVATDTPSIATAKGWTVTG